MGRLRILTSPFTIQTHSSGQEKLNISYPILLSMLVGISTEKLEQLAIYSVYDQLNIHLHKFVLLLNLRDHNQRLTRANDYGEPDGCLTSTSEVHLV